MTLEGLIDICQSLKPIVGDDATISIQLANNEGELMEYGIVEWIAKPGEVIFSI